MSLFTPIQGMIGGSLIGGSAGVLLVLNGDIMGASGILSSTLISPWQAIQNPKNHWRYVYLASFALTVNLFLNYVAPPALLTDRRAEDNDVPLPSTMGYLLGGLLVGIGTRLGNGCTTGHGICGIARFSKRSFIATCTFTGLSILTTYVISPLRSWSMATNFLRASGIPVMSNLASGLFMAGSIFVAMTSSAFSSKNRFASTTVLNQQELMVATHEDQKTLGAALSGSMFAAGLAISGMAKTSKVHDFLCLSGFSRGSFDPTLVAVLGSGIITSWLAYQFVNGWSILLPKDRTFTCPAGLSSGACFAVPTNKTIDGQLILGTAIFGIGWGLTGICPGPAIFAAASGNLNAIGLWLPAFVGGSIVGAAMKESWPIITTIPSTKKVL